MSYPSYVNPQVLTMFNVSTLLNQKDSRWLQLEVCREYQRQKCTRSDCECKFAHPPPNVEVQNGRVTACYDSIKVSALLLPDSSGVLMNPEIFGTVPHLSRYFPGVYSGQSQPNLCTSPCGCN